MTTLLPTSVKTDTSLRSPLVDEHNVWLGLPVRPELIPEAIKHLDQWVVWKAEPKAGGAMNKVPYTVQGHKASSINPSTWTDYYTALAGYQEDDSGWDGIGFMVRKETQIILLDFDHVRSGHTGVIDANVLAAIQRLGTYAEISPSGTGVRVIGFGTLERAITTPRLQGWVTGRYVTVTGHHLDEAPGELRPIDPRALAEIVAYFTPASQAAPLVSTAGIAPPLPASQCLEIRQALGYLDPDQTYDQWLQIGMALHSTGAANAFGLWHEWSATGAKFDAQVLRDKWGSFKDNGQGVQLASLFKRAMDAGWVNGTPYVPPVPEPVPAPAAAPSYTAREPELWPDHLLAQAPGVLGHLLTWGLATAHKPQPHLLLQAAIATAATAMARRYRTTRDNWPVLWLLGIAVTASGKEHGKTVLEDTLAAASLEGRIGGSGYTSPGAVFSALMDKPGHISVIDEFGKLMESSQAHGNQIKADAISILMETFGRAHSTLRPAAYSLMTLSKEQREAFRQRKVCKPHLGILAMTTPSTFYESLSRQWIADGFLGRFLVCESPIGRQPSRYPEPAPVPEDVVEWLLAVGCQPTADGNLLPYDLGADLEPTPIVLDFSAGARHSLMAFEADILARMNDVERHGLEALFGRTVEKAMRLAMVVCLAEGMGLRTISASQVQWAIDYVLACDASLVERAKWAIADSRFGRVKNACLELLRAAGAQGLTQRELGRKSAAFDGLRPREQSEILTALDHSGLAQLQNLAKAGQRGRPREAWVAVQGVNECD